MKRSNRRIPKRRLLFDMLEARQLLAAGNDFYELRSDGDLYADDFFLSTADPVIPTIDAAGRHVFDFSLNRLADQTTDITFPATQEPNTRIKLDPTQSYQFAFIGYEGEGAFVVEAFSSNGQSLGEIAVPYMLPAREGLNFFRYTYVHAMIGPAGQQLPSQTAWIDLVSPPQSPYARFGFVEDYAFSFQSDRSVDPLKSQVTLPVDSAQSYTLSAQAINHSSSAGTSQLHSLGYVGLDADRLVIEPIHTQKYGTSADARLASPLLPGDTSIALTTTEGWSNTSYDPNTRALAWYGYRDNSGTQYADFTYTRNVARDPTDGLWSRSGISGNRITLNKPWAGPTLPSGTAIRNAVDADPLVAVLLDHSPLVSSPHATLSGQWTGGTPQVSQFAPGTKFIQLAATINQSSVSVDERVSVRMQFDRNDTVVSVGPSDNRRVVSLDVLANDDSAATQVLSVTNGKFGTVEIAAGGRLVYRPQPYFIGTDAFTYESKDVFGNQVTRHVHIKSLGGNLDSDPALRLALENAAVTQTQYYPNLPERHQYVGVQDQTLNSSLLGNYHLQSHVHRLDEIGFQRGSLSLQASGEFVYHPVVGQAYRFPFLNTTSNGSDLQPAINVITIAQNEFRRDQARLSDIGSGLEGLESTYRRFFFPSSLPLDTNGRPFLSWRVHILPFVGYSDLYARFKQNEPWNSANNLPLLAEMPDIFRSGNEGPGVTSTRYQAIANSTYPSPLQLLLNNADGRGDLLRDSLIADDIENTLFVAQSGADKAVPWTQNVDMAFDSSNPLAALGNVGPYFNAYFLNQRVRALPTDMAPVVFQGLVTPVQGDLADLDTISRQLLTRPDFPGDGYVLNDRTQSEQMRALLLGMFNHESAFRRFSPSTTFVNNSLSWRVWLLPYIGQKTLFNQFHLNEAWDSPHNLSLAGRMPDIYRSLGDDASTNTTRFRVLGGTNMAYGHTASLRQGPRLSDFADGLTNTILIVEAGIDKAVPWTMGEVLPVDPGNFWSSMGSLPRNDLLIGMADGSTLRASRTTANELMIGLATINQGDSSRSAFQAALHVVVPSTPMDTSNKLKQVVLAAHNFESTYKNFPINMAGGMNTLPTATNVGLSWRVALLPYLEESALYNRFHLNEPWDSPHNLSLLPFMPSVYRTSAKPDDFTTRVQRFSGPNTIDPNQKIRFGHVTDGLSYTVFAGVVAAEKAVLWTKPDDIEFFSGSDWSVVGNTEFMPVAMADGSVNALHNDRYLGLSSLIGNDYLPFEMLVARNDGGPQYPATSTRVIVEGDPVAFNLNRRGPVWLEFEVPGLVEATSRSDGYLTRFGPQQRITLAAGDDRNGKRQTKLFVKAPSTNPDLPPVLVETINLIIVDREQVPKLNPIDDIVIDEDAQNTTLILAGISAGSGSQPALVLTARSSDTSLINTVSIDYAPGSTTALLSLTPVADQSGIAVIEVTAMNGGADGDLLTTSDNGRTARTFTVTVRAVNDAPSANSIADVIVSEDSLSQQTLITGISAGPGETQPLRVTATTNSLLLALHSTNLILAGSSTTLRWTPLADRFGQAVIYVQVEDGGSDGDLNSAADNSVFTTSFTITLTPQNDAPTIQRPTNQLVLEDAAEVIVPLEGIGAGPFESGDVLVTLSVGHPQLFEKLTLQRLPGHADGSLIVKTQADQSGSTIITLRVEDGGDDNDLATVADNQVTFTAFEWVTQPVNDMPELDSLANLVVDVDTVDLVVTLTGITAGNGEVQPLRVAATTTAGQLTSSPRIENFLGSTASLKFSTIGSTPGQATIQVVVEDAGLDGDLNTAADNLIIARQFLLIVNVPPAVYDDRFRLVKNQSGSLNVLQNDVDPGDSLTVVVTQAPPIEQGAVAVNADGALLFTPADGFVGVVAIDYQVIDQYGRGSGIARALVGVSNARFQNPFGSLDVNSDGQVTPLDALLIINSLNDPTHAKFEVDYLGNDDLDTNGDGAFSPIDALLVINELNRRSSV